MYASGYELPLACLVESSGGSMTLIEQCREQVRAVREAAQDPKAAYVIRSRLERLLLSCAAVIAAGSGQAEPDQPRAFGKIPEAPADIRELASACDALYGLSSSI